MLSIELEVLLILGLILANGLIVFAVTAIESASRSQLRDWASQGDGGAKIALDLSEDPTRLLWTVQGWTTLLGILAGVVGGAALVARVRESLPKDGALAAFQQGVAIGAVALAITVLSLGIGQLVPRRWRRSDRTAWLGGCRGRSGSCRWCRLPWLAP